MLVVVVVVGAGAGVEAVIGGVDLVDGEALLPVIQHEVEVVVRPPPLVMRAAGAVVLGVLPAALARHLDCGDPPLC